MDGSSTVPTPGAQPAAQTTGSDRLALIMERFHHQMEADRAAIDAIVNRARHAQQDKLTSGTEPENPKDRHGIAKPPMSCVPCPVLLEVGAVMRYGADKYGRHNWRDHKVIASVYYDATMRHLFQWWEGCDDDSDSGLPHLSHAIASLVVLRDSLIRDMAQDDRPPACPDGWVEAIKEKMR